ncbi:MAG: cytochrome c553 [Candidatus Azotimanducaceae bacterium]|jgi:cytochrome c553
MKMEISVKYIVLFLTLLAVLAISPVSNAANIAAGKEKAIIICAACHGDAGVSPNDDWPNLAGQKNGYLIKQIKAFRDGERVAPLMAPMVRSLTDTDVDNIAAYYSSLK